jgi:hypothetical protein
MYSSRNQDHLSFVSLRSEKYKFEYSGGIPNGLDESSRQLYMDSFILFALPINPDTLGKLRLKSMTRVLTAYTQERRQWVPSDELSIRVDNLTWSLACKSPSFNR